MEEVLDEVVLEDLCGHFQKVSILATTDCPKISCNPSGKSCNRCLDAFVVSGSSSVDSLVFSAESSAELVRCAELDKPGTPMGTKLSHLQSTFCYF